MGRFSRNYRALVRAVCMHSLEGRLLLSRTIYVDINAPGPTHDGSSWSNSYVDLQQGLTAAASGDQIHVADGVYKPTSGADRSAAFVLKSSVAIYGGYAGSGSANPDARDVANTPSILSGDIGTPGDNSDNSFHVVRSTGLTTTAILDGFTITAGNASGNSPNNLGGGMYNSSSSPTIRNCTFVNNSAADGGGMANVSSSPAITNVTFNGNSAVIGGGMYNASNAAPSIGNTAFANNSANSGGGMYNDSSAPTLNSCSFTTNAASVQGGAISNQVSSPSIDLSTFSDNTAMFGGAIDNESGSSPTLIDAVFEANSASSQGGGIYNFGSSSPAITNCIFVGNSAPEQDGAAIANDQSSSPTVVNSTIAFNPGGALFNGFNSTPTLANCILWGDGAELFPPDSAPNIAYSDVQGGWAGTGNINADPLFARSPSPGADGVWGTADDDYGDLRLASASPCINSGNNTAIPAGITTDITGNPRIVGGTVDMGAYELDQFLGTGETYVRVVGAFIEIWNNLEASGAPAAMFDKSVPSLSIVQPAGGSQTILDFGGSLNGNLVPSGGLSIIGGAGSDSVIFKSLNGPVDVANFGGHPINYTSVDTIGFADGAVTIASVPAGAGLAATGTAAVTLAQSMTIPSLCIDRSASVTLASGGNALRIGTAETPAAPFSLQITTPTVDNPATFVGLDLNDGGLIVQAGDPADRDTLLSAITTLVQKSRNTKDVNGVLWGGDGIRSSAAAALAAADTVGKTGLKGIGVAPNYKLDQNGNLSGVLMDSYRGQAGLDTDSVIAGYSFNGDTDLSGIVNFDDYFQTNTGFLSNGAKAGYRNGDFNYDSLINFDDYFLINSAFLGQGANAGVSPNAKTVAPVRRHSSHSGVHGRMHKRQKQIAESR